MTVGIVSAGHMGSGLGWALREGGERVVTTLDGRSPRSGRLATAAGLEILPTMDDVVRAADVILVVTPPGEARAAAHAITSAGHPSTPPGEARAAAHGGPLVADLNATSPSTVDDLAGIYHHFVDGSISGPPPTVRPGARIYLSGPRAAEVAGLRWRHVEPRVLDGPVGRASALKMCTASVYKGTDGLIAQALRAASHYGVLDEVLGDLRRAGIDNPARVAVAATKAHRYVPEMREIMTAQHQAGLTPTLFAAFADIFAEIARSPLGSADPETVDRALSAEDLVAGMTAPHES